MTGRIGAKPRRPLEDHPSPNKGHTPIAAMSGQTQTAPSTPFAAGRRIQLFALMSRLSLFGVPRAQTLAVFTLTEAIPGLVGLARTVREPTGWRSQDRTQPPRLSPGAAGPRAILVGTLRCVGPTTRGPRGSIGRTQR